MTATNMCSNFGGFMCRPPLLKRLLTSFSTNICTMAFGVNENAHKVRCVNRPGNAGRSHAVHMIEHLSDCSSEEP